MKDKAQLFKLNILTVLFIIFNIFSVNVFAAIPGNIDGTGGVDLKDAIIALKICAGTAPPNATIDMQADVNSDGEIGIAEAIYALQVVAGIIDGNSKTPGECLTSEESKLVRLVNDYRAANGLPRVPVSKSLTAVAQWHVIDLSENNPVTSRCNLHSWSNKKAELWTPVCYTSDHANASGMWEKPEEITKGVYTADGYENSYFSSTQARAQNALAAWQSDAHNDLILEKSIWKGKNWPAMGVGIYKNFGVLWFGNMADPNSELTTQCPGK